VHRINRKTPYLYEVVTIMNKEISGGEEREFAVRDRWLTLDDGWYHVAVNPMFFPEMGR
jgi:hypothetical protein